MFLLDKNAGHRKGQIVMIRLGHFSDLHYAGGANSEKSTAVFPLR
jgi:hypothetical protein